MPIRGYAYAKLNLQNFVIGPKIMESHYLLMHITYRKYGIMYQYTSYFNTVVVVVVNYSILAPVKGE